MPERIQRRRTPGWRMPEGAIYVGRPSRWGNPHRIGDVVHCRSAGRKWDRQMTAEDAVSFFEVDLRNGLLHFRRCARRDLVCWCPGDHPCHADVLLEVANG